MVPTGAVLVHIPSLPLGSFEPAASAGRAVAICWRGRSKSRSMAGSQSVFKAGDVIFVPAGASHNVTNVGKATAKVLAT